MLQYLIILLDDTSTSFCHYTNTRKERKLIPPDVLKASITFAMKEDLYVQFVYPDYELPPEYAELIETVEHSKIKPATCADREADVVVIDNWQTLGSYPYDSETAYVWHTGKDDFFNHHTLIARVLPKVARLNVVITDIDSFDEEDLEDYAAALQNLAKDIEPLCQTGTIPQLNLLTDRLLLNEMNNCNAGWQSVTLAPNGKFYICPAFYLEDEGNDLGSVTNGLDIRNPQLYRLEYAPICRHCDAYQCKRCIWLNRKMTLEVNTPSREQCLTAHLERNASRQLLAGIRQVQKNFLPHTEIKEIDYLDPFEICRR
ncbi:CXXX repeat peptide maturase [Bacteroides gallinaceum]|uniref:CXXX repeat peptide maturase n=1 Tax=Bacteroides gallinaceum TaxID=1462571 RepID=UPI0025AB3844|nr:CXXX repeat peptide maturase [Bacteroides gallinaceum]MDN0068035.1 CXXX repeat peptide maturase [Bacteroides gallinaceum]